ncbi:MAG: DNRLRE domain-containing protein [Candidatus Coatesbacteria bacterium]|nr:DNRLRE domain-containing protein [Candidatus Coatesbacteria bacterium]
MSKDDPLNHGFDLHSLDPARFRRPSNPPTGGLCIRGFLYRSGEPTKQLRPAGNHVGILSCRCETMILLRFDELDDYQGVTVNALTLEFYVESISELIYTRVYRVGEGWSEDSVTWNNRPSLVPGTDIVSIIPDFGCRDDVDITDYGIEWLENGAANNGLYMIFDTDDYDSCVISSAENADPSHAPRLILDYTPLTVETASWGAIKAMEQQPHPSPRLGADYWLTPKTTSWSGLFLTSVGN